MTGTIDVPDHVVTGWMESHWGPTQEAKQASYAEGRRSYTEVLRAHYAAQHDAAAAKRDALDDAAEKMRAMPEGTPE